MKLKCPKFIKCPRFFKKGGSIVPVIRLNGTIIAGMGRQKGLNLANIEETIEKAFKMKKAPAVALLINSPGGSPVQSHFIYKKIRKLAEDNQKPVLAFVEDVAASGGYMIAIAGDEIIADESSIVGSIGVVAAGFGFDQFIQKHGVERRVYTAGKNKVMLDPFLPEDPKSIEHLKNLQLDIHDHFISLVQARRKNLAQPDENEIFTGRIWTGRPAKKIGIVDQIGNIDDVLKQRYGDKVESKLLNPQKRGFFDMFSSKYQAEDIASALRYEIEAYANEKRFGL